MYRHNILPFLFQTTGLHEENIPSYLRSIGKDAGDVKAVILDLDLNQTLLDLMKATNYLREDPDCCFFACVSEKNVAFGGKMFLGKSSLTE